MKISYPMKFTIGILLPAILIMFFCWSCSDDNSSNPKEKSSSRAYKGHESDVDINNLVQTYPAIYGTRLDDCQACHTQGTVLAGGTDEVHANPCDYCHYIIHPPDGYTQLPTSYSETLNPYGFDYMTAGRNKQALKSIEDEDSDGDGYSNKEEINDLRYPGDEGSYPGLVLCPSVTITYSQISSMKQHTQFGLANTNKQQFDYYATYTGVKITDLLKAKGIDLTGATNIDILAPDGFYKTFDMDQIAKQFPAHKFYSGFGVDDLGADCSFVEYPENVYSYGYGDDITDEQWHIIAYAREDLPLEESYLDPSSGKINGEGPYRNIIPPASDDPSMNAPDRGKDWDASGCPFQEWNYNSGKEHNAGSMVKGVVIIRIQPMPEGCEEFDIMNGGWALVNDREILVYGHNIGN